MYVCGARMCVLCVCVLCGKVGVDGGGPKRELFTLLGCDIVTLLFEGESCRGVHDIVALQVCGYTF